MKPEKLFEDTAPVAGSGADLPLIKARVLAASGDGFKVRHGGGLLDATVAFSCLLRPEAGDEVLLAREETGDAYILSIIARPGKGAARLEVPGDLEIAAENCRIQGHRSVNLVSPGGLNMVSGTSTLETGRLTARFGEATLTGKVATAVVGVVRGFHDLLDQSVKTVLQRAGTYMRQTESLDHVKSGQMDRTTRGLYNLNSKFTVMMSSKDTKIDGERIHMG